MDFFGVKSHGLSRCETPLTAPPLRNHRDALPCAEHKKSLVNFHIYWLLI